MKVAAAASGWNTEDIWFGKWEDIQPFDFYLFTS